MIPKFRAWDKTHKKLGMIDADMQDGLFQSVKIFDEDGDDWQESENFILMQSTGLKDKNGKEIFEGDVVVMDGWRRQVVTFGTQEVEEDFGSVRIYRGFNLYLGGGYPNAVMSTFEVVGNIYENPELVEGDA
ncbi:YopX family protein [Streptococcus anginosus]|uniref:YopX protein domain-containing protein n=1 Tax=Streptococcus anginosus TaxID=1328 RepID=A0A412PL72_STRAP|nr:YopX family protein [Streptococcus anginosus]MCW1031258.1 YopX family protein [Streptococcus anginosus]MCW1067690.1 YopX family protein [Streptococcus anginosus]MCW1077861.1 YopX family protein [Streptococcus anginosus]RGT59445.1 hypothetical protein DWX18_09405 [Streptococcus anginosus]RGT61404.1 hypothetical protein DWX18_04165 [Streptococcus anginosus]